MSLVPLFILIISFFIRSTCSAPHTNYIRSNDAILLKKTQTCELLDGFSELKKHINFKRPDVDKIMDLVLDGPERGKTYSELALFCDTFGPRMSGSKSLASAIDYMYEKMTSVSKLDVTREPVSIPKWEVGKQSLKIIQPVERTLDVLALGNSASSNGTIRAPVIVVHSFDDLERLGTKNIKDKIVLYNNEFTNYGESVAFRSSGAIKAVKFGALAALVRSVTPFSIHSIHTGYSKPSTIPTGAIAIEDAALIQRLRQRNLTVILELQLETTTFEDAESYNLIGDIKGSVKPDEIVLVSGHIDSWYNTVGAMDDGGGMMISYKALDVLSKLGLRTKRTMRAVLWTSEEFGLYGAQKYFTDYKDSLKHRLVIESDMGTFKPLGLGATNLGPLAKCAIQSVLELTARMNTTILSNQYEGSDIEVFSNVGTPSMSLLNDNSQYFWYHHSAGDTMEVENSDYLDRGTALLAIATYILSDLDIKFTD